jgi:hypothetical protein
MPGSQLSLRPRRVVLSPGLRGLQQQGGKRVISSIAAAHAQQTARGRNHPSDAWHPCPGGYCSIGYKYVYEKVK